MLLCLFCESMVPLLNLQDRAVLWKTIHNGSFRMTALTQANSSDSRNYFFFLKNISKCLETIPVGKRGTGFAALFGWLIHSTNKVLWVLFKTEMFLKKQQNFWFLSHHFGQCNFPPSFLVAFWPRLWRFAFEQFNFVFLERKNNQPSYHF